MDDFDLEDKPELNITPLVDIMLVLLAILIVTTPAVTYKEDINLPAGSKSNKVEKSPMLIVRMDKNKLIYIDKETYKFDEFADNISLRGGLYDKTRQVYLRADRSIAYGDIVFILKVLKDVGFSKISLVTS